MLVKIKTKQNYLQKLQINKIADFGRQCSAELIGAHHAFVKIISKINFL